MSLQDKYEKAGQCSLNCTSILTFIFFVVNFAILISNWATMESHRECLQAQMWLLLTVIFGGLMCVSGVTISFTPSDLVWKVVVLIVAVIIFTMSLAVYFGLFVWGWVIWDTGVCSAVAPSVYNVILANLIVETILLGFVVLVMLFVVSALIIRCICIKISSKRRMQVDDYGTWNNAGYERV